MSISICKYCDKHFDEDYEVEHEEVCRENINFRKETMKKKDYTRYAIWALVAYQVFFTILVLLCICSLWEAILNII